jgi:hypothetical protein
MCVYSKYYIVRVVIQIVQYMDRLTLFKHVVGPDSGKMLRQVTFALYIRNLRLQDKYARLRSSPRVYLNSIYQYLNKQPVYYNI